MYVCTITRRGSQYCHDSLLSPNFGCKVKPGRSGKCGYSGFMLSMAEVIQAHSALTEAQRAWLHLLVDQWDVLADMAFSDLILWVPAVDDNIFWAAAQYRVTTGPTALEEDVVGEEIAYDPEHLVTEAYLSRRICSTSGNKLQAGIPVEVSAIPIVFGGDCIGVLEVHTNQMGVRAPGALEDNYLETATILIDMVLRGEYPLRDYQPATWLSPNVGNGSIRVNSHGTVTFASPNARSAFRRLGLTRDLVGEPFLDTVKELADPSPEAMSSTLGKVLRGQQPYEAELVHDHVAVQIRVLPLTRVTGRCGLLVLCRDTTELRSRERQLVTKDATIREIHHRVKNNLQSVAALLRLQARRIESPEARGALQDAMKRVGAIAIVHEILSQSFNEDVKFDDIADRLLTMVGSVAASGGQVHTVRDGSFGMIPADIATNLSLVFTELCQNAIEHGLAGISGTVAVRVERKDGNLIMTISNSGRPLPADFSLASSSSLGLSIVKALVQDLDGIFTLSSVDGSRTEAKVVLPLTRL